MLTQVLCTSFKAEVLLGVHDFRATSGDTFKLALYTSLASLDANTTAYTSTGEVTGTGYTAGGTTLTNLGVVTTNTDTASGVGSASFSPATFPGATITARGALIYNTTPSATANDGSTLTNPAVCVLDFGSDKTVTGTTLTITFPAATGSSAIIRIA
jgi:hypothetical protein